MTATGVPSMTWELPGSRSIVRVDAHVVSLLSLGRHSAGWGLLSGEEKRFAASIGSASRWHSYVAARSFLRERLSDRLGCRPAAVPIVRPLDGKPRLARGGIEFSVAHTAGWIAVALSEDCAVGIDAEPVRPLTGMDEVAADFFPPAGWSEYAAASPDERGGVFFRWWTRLEAVVKACGRGLDDAASLFDETSFESYDAVPGLALTVAARSRSPLRVQWHIGTLRIAGQRIPDSVEP